MKSFLLFTSTGPVLILSKYNSVNQPKLLDRLTTFGKFVVHEVNLDAVRSCYAAHFEHVFEDPKENQAMIVLDDDGQSIFTNISLRELGYPWIYEPGDNATCMPVPNPVSL